MLNWVGTYLPTYLPTLPTGLSRPPSRCPIQCASSPSHLTAIAPALNRMLPREKGCTHITVERKYYHVDGPDAERGHVREAQPPAVRVAVQPF